MVAWRLAQEVARLKQTNNTNGFALTGCNNHGHQVLNECKCAFAVVVFFVLKRPDSNQTLSRFCCGFDKLKFPPAMIFLCLDVDECFRVPLLQVSRRLVIGGGTSSSAPRLHPCLNGLDPIQTAP